MEQKQLNFAEQAVQVLTLGELERSYHENLPTGDPVGGIYHFALIQQVLAIFEKRGLTPVVQEIFAAANRDSKRPGVTLLPQLEEQYGERSVEAHLLRRVYANIEIRSDETDELVTCLAVAYHQKGIQLGIGPMVRVCHNQTILGAQDVVSNYTCYGGQSRKDKLSLESVIGRAELWADEYEPYQKIRRERMSALKSAEFTRTDMLQLIGILVEKRILHDTQNEELHLSTPYPLNSSQINETSEQMITLMSHQQPQSYWDAYQQLNTVLKPGRMDIPQVLPQSLALFETMYELIR
ncbi:MAG: DUF932 domain-containing protein [Prevotella sp.]|jgi:hypothetical protein|nr:DUF932 domain-containing protein [Prevotella sp.]